MIRLFAFIISLIWKLILLPFRIVGWIFGGLSQVVKHERSISTDAKKYGYSKQFVRAFKVEQKRHDGTGSFYDGYTLEDHYRDMNHKDLRGDR